MRRDCEATLAAGSSVVAVSTFDQLHHYVSAQPSLPRYCWPQKGRATVSPSGAKESDAAEVMRRTCRRFYQHSTVAEKEARERRWRRDCGSGGGWPERAPLVARGSAPRPAAAPFARDRAEASAAAPSSAASAKFASEDDGATAMQETMRAACRRMLRACAARPAAATAAAAAGRLSNTISLSPVGGRSQLATVTTVPIAGLPRQAASMDDGAVTSQLALWRWTQQKSARRRGEEGFAAVSSPAEPPSALSERCNMAGGRCCVAAYARSRSRSSSADSGIKSRDSLDDAAPLPVVNGGGGGEPAYSEPGCAPFDGACQALPLLPKPPSLDVEAENQGVIPSPFGKERTRSAASITNSKVAESRKSSVLSKSHTEVSDADYVCCSNCSRTQSKQGALCAYYRMCPGCGALYCSVTCRRNAWAAHKTQCGYSFAVSRIKRVLRQLLTDQAMRKALSDFAVSGYIRQGRGVVYLPLGPVDESWCFEEALSAAWSRRFYVRKAALQMLPERLLTSHSDALLAKCTVYDPQTHFVLLSTSRFWISDRPKCGSDSESRVEEYVKLMALQLRRKQDTEVLLQRQTCSSGEETLVVSPTCSSYDATLFGRRARQLFFMNVQTALRSRGVSLRLQYPQLYRDLCRYVDCGGDITPTSLFGADRRGRRFMCCILPPPKSDAV